MDGSRDAKGREVVNMIVVSLNSDLYRKPYLIQVALLEKADSSSMAMLVNMPKL